MGSSDGGRRSRSSKKSKKSSSSKRSRHYSSDSDSEREQRAKRKLQKKSEKMLATFGYSNDTNPFGDSNLSQPFVWGKKVEDQRKKREPVDTSEKALRKRQLERMDEIRKARERRDQREQEKEEMERLKTEELRLRDAEQYEDWQQKEEEFHLGQAKVRSKLRIQERREKPVDVLAKNLLLVAQIKKRKQQELNGEDVVDAQDSDLLNAAVRMESRRPYKVIEVLSMDELLELRENIAAYLELEIAENGENQEFWELLAVVCRDRIQRLRRSQSEGRVGGGAIHDSVSETITDMLQNKSAKELRELKKEASKTIASAENTTGVDVEFWEDVSQQIDVYLARLRLADLHEDMLEKLRDVMDKQQEETVPVGSDHVARAEDGQSLGTDDSREAREMERSFARKELDESETQFDAADEVAIAELPSWSEKYQPRKPRYFNRVKTGYDWNKYNQTHYDHDNPPPKVVQGYKFNLFYPDLIDKSTAPRFFLERANGSEFCIIRFSAGPPYQDIAFKIVNREWEYSHKRGFKSVFERGILHLYFNFKRHRYRR